MPPRTSQINQASQLPAALHEEQPSKIRGTPQGTLADAATQRRPTALLQPIEGEAVPAAKMMDCILGIFSNNNRMVTSSPCCSCATIEW